MSWLDDPKLARRLARTTWLVLVGAFVVLTRYELGALYERLALGAMLLIVCVLNAPVAIGLYKSRAQADTRAFRFVALALAMRAIATILVLFIVTPR